MLQLMGGYFINTCWSLVYNVLIMMNGVHRRLLSEIEQAILV